MTGKGHQNWYKWVKLNGSVQSVKDIGSSYASSNVNDFATNSWLANLPAGLALITNS